MSILVLQSSWWGRGSWLFCLICLPGVSWKLSGSSSWCHGVACGLWLWSYSLFRSWFRIGVNKPVCHTSIVLWGLLKIAVMCQCIRAPQHLLVVLFDLVLYRQSLGQSTVFQSRVFMGWTSTKQGLMCLAKVHNAVPPVRHEPAILRCQVKHSTTEPLRSWNTATASSNLLFLTLTSQ